MNVQELIDTLMKIEDKSKPVVLSRGVRHTRGMLFTRDVIVSVAPNTVWISDENGTTEKCIENTGNLPSHMR